MSEAASLFVVSWLGTQVGSLLMLEVGSRYARHPYLMKLGALAHRKKMRALERVWPLTRLRRAAEEGDRVTSTVILSSAIVVKSVASLALGVVMVFWLPLASLVVPSIITVHDPNDPSLIKWVKRVASLQVTSHALAAALGFALVVSGPLAGASLIDAAESNPILLALVSATSLGFAIAAGRAEAAGIVQRGI